MNNEVPMSRAEEGLAGECEMLNEHERRQRIRSERMRKWRKETRHPREGDLDEGAQGAPARRCAP